MKIKFQEASRKFGNQLIFQNLNLEIKPGERWAILGANGSGKSTFLKCAYGALTLSSGKVIYERKNTELDPAKAAYHIGYSAPYFELIEELSAHELLETVARFKPWRKSWNAQSILESCLLSDSKNKRIADFSSGMKQRLRLGMALASEVDLVILDEPCSNLDVNGLKWYQNFLKDHLDSRSLIVGTNYSEEEAFLCDQKLLISDYQ